MVTDPSAIPPRPASADPLQTPNAAEAGTIAAYEAALDRIRAATHAIIDTAQGISHRFRGQPRAVTDADVERLSSIAGHLAEAKAVLDELTGTMRWAWENEA